MLHRFGPLGKHGQSETRSLNVQHQPSIVLSNVFDDQDSLAEEILHKAVAIDPDRSVGGLFLAYSSIVAAGSNCASSPSQGSYLLHRSTELLYRGCLTFHRLGVLTLRMFSS